MPVARQGRPAAGFLPPDARARVRPLWAWRAEERRRVGEAVLRAAEEWRRSWGLRAAASGGAAAAAVRELRDALPVDGVAFVPLDDRGGAWWALAGGATRSALAPLSLALVGERAAPDLHGTDASLAGELVLRSWRDLQQRLAAALLLGRNAAPPSAPPQLEPWSDALVVAVAWWDTELLLVLSREAIAPLAARPAPRPHGRGKLVPLSTALAARGLRIEVRLRALELELGAIASLRAGDVVRTTHRLHQPLSIEPQERSGAEASVLLAGFLGHVDGRWAVALVSPSGSIAGPKDDRIEPEQRKGSP